MVAEVSLLISWPIVALNSTVCTSWLTIYMIFFISASKPSYRSLSASSNTIISKFSIPMLREFISKSMILPGVPITSSGLLRNWLSCLCRLLAPMVSTASNFVYLFSLENS